MKYCLHPDSYPLQFDSIDIAQKYSPDVDLERFMHE